MNADLEELAERVEKAPDGDRGLDADIALSQGWNELPGDNWVGPHGQICVPAYTASLDAAMTLVPEDSRNDWSLIGGRYWQAEVGDEMADAATPALALCAAALKVRAILKGSIND